MLDRIEAEAAIAKALCQRTVPGYDALDPGDREAVDWAAAPPYVRRHLADHAAAAGDVGYGLIDRLLQDERFLSNASLPNLRATLATALPEPRLQSAVDAMTAARRSADEGGFSPEEEPGLLLAQLSLAARSRGLEHLADSIPVGTSSAAWRVLWAAWRPEPTTWPLNPVVTGERHSLVTVPDPSAPTVVTVSADQKLHVFDVLSAREIGKEVQASSRERAEHLVAGVVSGRGLVVATIGEEGACQVRSAASLKALGPPFFVGRLAGAAFVEVAGGVRLLAVKSSGTFRLWDVVTRQVTGRCDREVSGDTVRSVCVLASKHGVPASVVLGLEGGGVHRLGLETEGPAIEFADHGNRAVRGLAAIDIRNEQIVVAGSDDGQIRIWKDAGASVRMIQPERTNAPSAVQLVICTSVGGVPITVAVTHDVARTYNLDTGEEIASWSTRAGRITSVTAVTVNERSLAVFTVARGRGAEAPDPVVWDLNAAGSAYEPFDRHTKAIQALALGRIAGRRRLVTGSRDATVRVWDPDGGGQVGHALDVAEPGASRRAGCTWALALAESGEDHYIVSGEDDGSIRFWNAGDGRLMATVPSLDSTVYALLSTQIGGRPAIVAGTRAGRLVVVRIGQDRVEIDRPAQGGLHSVRALAELWPRPDGTRSVVAAGDNDHLYVWSPETGEIRSREHAQKVAALVVLRRGVVLTGGDDGRVLRVDLDDEDEPTRELVPVGKAVTAMALAEEDRRLVLVTAHADESLRFTALSAAAGPVGRRIRTRSGVVRALGTYSANRGTVVLAAGDNHVVSQWDLRGRRTVLHRDRVWAVTTFELTRRGDPEAVAISGSGDDTLQVRSLRTGTVRRLISARQGGVRSLACARTDRGPVLLSGGVDGTVEIHDLGGRPDRPRDGGAARPARLRVAEQHDWVRAIGVGLTPAGAPIAAAGAGDGTVMCWRLNEGRPQPRVRRIHDQGVRAVAVSELDCGPVVVSGGMDGQVVVSDFETLQARSPSWRHTEGVRAIAVCRVSGRPVVVSGDAGGEVLLRRLDDGSDLGPVPHGVGEVNALATHEVNIGDQRVWIAVATGRMITLSSSNDGGTWQKRTSVLVDRDVLSLSLQGGPDSAGPEHLAVASTLGVLVIEFPDWQ